MLLLRTAGAKTNLSMCLKRREALSLGRFAEQVLTCLKLSAADVPCRTAPFASFSGRTEKEGPAWPERGPIFSSLVKAIKKGKHNGEFLRNRYDATMSLFRQAVRVQRALFNLTKLFGSGKVLRWQLSLTAVKMEPS